MDWSSKAAQLRDEYLDPDLKHGTGQYQAMLCLPQEEVIPKLINYWTIEITVNTLILSALIVTFFNDPEIPKTAIGDIFAIVTTLLATVLLLSVLLTTQVIFDITKIRDDCIHEVLAKNLKYFGNLTVLSITVWLLLPMFFFMAILTFWEGLRMYVGCSITGVGVLVLFVVARKEALAAGPRRNMGKMISNKKGGYAEAKAEVQLIRQRIVDKPLSVPSNDTDPHDHSEGHE
eukprot:CAMPEP_0175133428 /NCGR_PEP_ID=MMETSP0087-20121206/7637_1 /TAXON_ID=136419 /ORGANISM="Unknown Unknown, Strain D1" /LENGTH=231 /DNA_ID=CAMNT_0016415917 /DNA_START=45 /DNA_END=740 /DNA_ORIENTATION=-